MLTLQDQRDRLLAALEQIVDTLTRSNFGGKPVEIARALIAECRAAPDLCIACYANISTGYSWRGLCVQCAEPHLGEPPEAGRDPDTAAVSGKERLEDH